MAVEDPSDRIDELVATASENYQTVFLEMVAYLRDQFSLDDVVSLLETGRFEDAFDVVAARAATLGSAWGEAYVDSGKSAGEFLADAVDTVHVSFDGTNVRAVAAMKENQLRLVREFTAQQRDATHAALVDGMRDGLSPREVARRFRDSMGLTQYQEQAVQNYREALESGGTGALSRELRDRRFDPTVRRAAREGTSLTDTQVDRMVDRYRESMLGWRAETIARTEMLGAVHRGNQEMYQQAIDAGQIDADSLERTWNTAEDERVRESHADMDGQVQGFGDPFESGDGNDLMFPGDGPPEDAINCRCSISTRILASNGGDTGVSVETEEAEE